MKSVNNNIDLALTIGYIGNKLSEARKRRGLTQKQIAEMSGLSPTTISNIERGGRDYSLTSLFAYAQTLEYDVTVHKIGKPVNYEEESES